MAASHEEIIIENLADLCDKTHCTIRLLDSCLGKRILTLDQCEEIAMAKLEYERNRIFYLILRNVDQANVLKIIQIMEEDKTRQVPQVLDILKTSIQGQESSRTAELDPSASPIKSPVVIRLANDIRPTANPFQPNPSVPKKVPTNLKSDLEKLNQDCSKSNLHDNGIPSTITPEISCFHFAVKAGDVSLVNGLIRQGVDVNCANEKGCTALHSAAQNGDQYMAELLLRNRANPNISSGDNVTPLHLAAKCSVDSIAKVLLENGANVNATTSRRHETPLIRAISSGNCKIINLLLDHGADVNAKCYRNMTPLHYAAQYRRVDVVNMLIAKGAEVNALDSEKFIPLHNAAAKWDENVKVIETLITNGAFVNANDKLDRTPLHRAIISGHLDNVKALVQRGADDHACGYEQNTTLHLAVLNNHFEMVRFLVEEAKADINRKDKYGSTPLETALMLGSGNDYRELIVKYLIDKGAVKG